MAGGTESNKNRGFVLCLFDIWPEQAAVCAPNTKLGAVMSDSQSDIASLRIASY